MILNSSGKLGGNSIDFHHTNMSNETLNKRDLNDLGYYGPKYTWANNQSDNDHINERLDRFCASSNWILYFPRFTNTHLLTYTFDHNPIMLEFYTTSECYNAQSFKKIHRFEQLWAYDKDSIQIVKNSWNTMTGTITKKLHFTLDQLHKWGIDKYGHIPNQIKTRQAKLATLKNDIPTHDCIIKIKDMETNQDEL